MEKNEIENLKVERKKLLKELKKERNMKAYAHRKCNKIVCSDCCVCVDPFYFKKHCETKSHKNIVERKKKIWN